MWHSVDLVTNKNLFSGCAALLILQTAYGSCDFAAF